MRGAAPVAQRVVDQVGEDAFEQRRRGERDRRRVEAVGLEIDPGGVGARDEREHDLAHELVDAHRHELAAVARLVGEREREELIDQSARALLALHDAFELAAPDLGILVCQAVLGERADAGERRAQIVRDVAGELALRLHAEADAREQRVDRVAQARDVARHRLACDRVGSLESRRSARAAARRAASAHA